jgi:hypothetical protein
MEVGTSVFVTLIDPSEKVFTVSSKPATRAVSVFTGTDVPSNESQISPAISFSASDWATVCATP